MVSCVSKQYDENDGGAEKVVTNGLSVFVVVQKTREAEKIYVSIADEWPKRRSVRKCGVGKSFREVTTVKHAQPCSGTDWG